jgi:hypothetical protein
MQQLGEGDRALLERHRIEDGAVAAPLRPATDGGEEIALALRRLGAGRCDSEKASPGGTLQVLCRLVLKSRWTSVSNAPTAAFLPLAAK